MDIPREIITFFDGLKEGKNNKGQSLKSEIERNKDFGKEKRKVQPIAHAKPIRKGKGSGLIFATHHDFSQGKWEQYVDNATKKDSFLLNEENLNMKSQRLSLSREYGKKVYPKKDRSGKSVTLNPKPKAAKQKQETVVVKAYNYSRRKSLERKRKANVSKSRRLKNTQKKINMNDLGTIRNLNCGTGPSVRAAKQLRRTFSNFYDHQAMK